MELEKARELKHSTLWLEVEKELNEKIAVEIQKLRSCEKDELERLQTRIELLEEIKRLPQDVIDREEAP